MNKSYEIEGKRTTVSSDYNWKGLYRLSGILLILTAVIWSIVFQTARALYSSGYPADAASYLGLVSQHQGLASLTWGLWIVADFLLMAPTIALYLVLKSSNRTLALVGVLFAMFFNIYDICVTELNSLTLVSLSHGYALAANEALKAPFVAAATYGYQALPLQTVLSFASGTVGYFLWCIPMLKSPFRRGTAIFGAGMCGIALIGSAAPLFPASIVMALFQMITLPACALWFILLGIQLYRYGKQPPATTESVQENRQLEYSA